MSLDCSRLLAAQRSLGYCLEPGVSAPLPAVALDGAWGDRAVVNLGTTSFPLPLQAVACGNKGALALIGANNGSLWGTRLVPTGPGAWEKAVALADANAGTSAWMAGIGADGTCQGTAVWAETRGKQNILRYARVETALGFGAVQSGESAVVPYEPYAGFRVVQGQTGDAEVGYYWPSPTGSPSIPNTDAFTTRTVQKAGTLSDPVFHNTFELAGGQLAQLRDGRVLAAYVEGNKAQNSDSFALMFIERAPTGPWSAPRALLTSPGMGLLAVVPAGDRIYAILGQAGSPARLLQILPGATTPASDQATPTAVPLGSQSVVAASGNTFHVAWIDPSSPPLLKAARWVDGSGWTQPENVGAAGYPPLHVYLVADAKQRVTLVFDTTDTKNPVLLGNRFVPGTGWLGVHQIETDDSHSAKVLTVDASENVLLMYARYVSTTGFVYARWYTPNP